MPTLNDLLIDILEHAEADAEKTIYYATMLLSIRRRIRAAMQLLGEQRVDEARLMLEAALADDGSFLKRRMDKIMEEFNDDWPPAA